MNTSVRYSVEEMKVIAEDLLAKGENAPDDKVVDYVMSLGNGCPLDFLKDNKRTCKLFWTIAEAKVFFLDFLKTYHRMRYGKGWKPNAEK